MATNATQTRTCWVNAGNKAVVFNPIDGKGWTHPVFVNASAELRVFLLNALAPTAEAPKGYTLTVEISKSELVRTKTSKGETAFKFDIADDSAFVKRVWATRRVKGSMNEDRKSALDSLASELGLTIDWSANKAPSESTTSESDPFAD